MADYRCYPIALSGSIDGPAHVVDAEDDTSAIVKAREILPEQSFEVWQGARRVCFQPPSRRRLSGARYRDQGISGSSPRSEGSSAALAHSEHLLTPMNRIATLHEQAAVMRKLAESFGASTIKTDLLMLAEHCDRLAEAAATEITEPA